MLPDGLDGRALDPETAARRFLDQALASPAVPSLAAPVANGATSEFKTIGTETVPLTGTKTVKFRQTLHGIPVYGSLVTVEVEDDNSLIAIDSALGTPDGRRPGGEHRAGRGAGGGRRRARRIRPEPDRRRSEAQLLLRPRLVDLAAGLHPGGRSGHPGPRAPSPRRTGPARSSRPDSWTTWSTRTTGRSSRCCPARRASHPGPNRAPSTPSASPARSWRRVRTGTWCCAIPCTTSRPTTSASATRPSTATGCRVTPSATRRPGHRPRSAPRPMPSRCPISCARCSSGTTSTGRAARWCPPSTASSPQDSPGPKQWINAFWNGEQMVYGQVLRPDGLRSLSANIDVVAHEMFHGVTDHTSRLEYALQPGALNESYSDIFGTIIANLGNDDPRTWDWLLGEKLMVGDKPFRDLSDPDPVRPAGAHERFQGAAQHPGRRLRRRAHQQRNPQQGRVQHADRAGRATET